MAADLESAIPGYTGFAYIDRGGMGAVYSAMQTSLERRVAIKILPPDLGEDQAFVDSFHREARLLARLQHPHIVAVYDFGRNALGHLFIVMEYVEGTSLLDIMKRERLPVRRVLEIISQVCEALQFAHDYGVVHRDIKPTNILIDSRGRVRVADFGLARSVRADSVTTSQTRSSLMMGTPVYAAPEQRRPNSVLDHRADIFSVGVTLYEMLTGHVPVGVFEPPSKKSDSPAALDKVVTRSLRESPSERYQKAADMRAAIEKTAARLTQPVIQRAIASRPIVSMMTTVIVTSCLIYLFGEINVMLNKKPGVLTREDLEARLVTLDKDFVLLSVRSSWEEARRAIASHADLELASFHSVDELTHVSSLLKDRGIRSSVWTGGHQPKAGAAFVWTDGTAFDFESWMPAARQPPVIVTELQAKNRHTIHTEAGDTPDWIEVYNPGTTTVDLSGWQLRHLQSMPGGTRFTGGRLGLVGSKKLVSLLLEPGQYKVITCYDLPDETGWHFNFQLEAQGARIIWTDPQGNIIQAFDRDWDAFKTDASLVADASGMNWSWSTEPTPGAANQPIVGTPVLSAVPPVPQPTAIQLLPEFEGRWSREMSRRPALAIARRKVKVP